MIEKQLCELAQADGKEFLVQVGDEVDTEAWLGSVNARGENLDIAIMRLANVLLEDPRYHAPLTEALRNIIGATVSQDSAGESQKSPSTDSPSA